MNKQKVTISLMMFAVMILMFVTVVFAWISLSDAAKINPIELGPRTFRNNFAYEVKKNDDDFVLIETEEEMEALFVNALPGDQFTFRVTLENISSTSFIANTRLSNIRSINSNPGFNMLNVFYLLGGTYQLNDATIAVDLIDLDDVTVEGQPLSLYRFSNIVMEGTNLILTNGFEVASEATMVLIYTIVFDPTTEHILYQDGSFSMDSITIVLD